MSSDAAVPASTPVVFLHSSNQHPSQAWPPAAHLTHSRVAFMPGYDTAVAVPFDQDAWEARLLEVCAGGAVVAAHSFGGPVAMRAALRRPDLIRALVLFEPAAYAIARGATSIEAHINRMQPVLDRADLSDASDFIVEFMTAMTGAPTVRPASPEALLAAERQRLLPGPWTLDTPSDPGVPTLVITGGWNDEYEVIAATIPSSEHVTLVGHGHRPQDHQDAAKTITRFLGEL